MKTACDLLCTLDDEFWHHSIYINKDLGFSKGSPSTLYRQRSPLLTSDAHPAALFWKQAWNMTETSHFRKEKQGIQGGKS